MLKRVGTALIGLLLFFGVVFSHHYVLYIAVTLISLGMIHEMNKMLDCSKELSYINLFVGLLMCFGSVVNIKFFALILSFMFYGAAVVIMHSKVDSKKMFESAFSTIFLTLFMGMLISIRKLDKFIIILPFVCAWLSDTGAYLIGSAFGKHKISKIISPNKTLEGAIAGVIFSAVGCILFISLMTGFEPSLDAVILFGLIGVTASLISQCGDLIFSCVKRDAGKKDYGAILPGHGGILDRFDSVVFILPYIYYVVVYFII